MKLSTRLSIIESIPDLECLFIPCIDLHSTSVPFRTVTTCNDGLCCKAEFLRTGTRECRMWVIGEIPSQEAGDGGRGQSGER
ncbi:unnamed protein product [Lasius platythorax]|uniref:Uncharacterized protein n=1 Tax=Lasius platythorax TaxID=488582 RepID=A0AAV2NTX7_9HYME